MTSPDTAPEPATATIRPYRPEDAEALDEICVRTGHDGHDSRPHYTDPGVLTATFAAPYAHLEPDLAFVLDDGRGRAVGYILGTADTARFAAAFRAHWLPRVAARWPDPAGEPRTRDERIARLLHRPERMIVPELAAHPAHLHIDLLPGWQGRGHGRALTRTFLRALRERGVPSVHLLTGTANTAARAFYDRLGFRRVDVPSLGPETTAYARTTEEDPDRPSAS
ncbi:MULTISPECIES: GNAT family N-acetyltransferase [Streptomyces]|uniref:Ribosomal protein S18 acetylase RimI-like enzyme n=2 Tax=Streptomyces TaxID=1883 RepID=A0ABT9L837_STRGD|nr:MULTISPECIES: GNAT family N-acetyltransferase [Streptomyces]MDP9679874.1 ribosomal protein S18 acetylase RimI-like enzyme [Streptomyces griseoviridis]GGT23381.1 acetyltransferase [Streptomyces griseoviridis]GGU65692.1 acetyltransferase [Streptomyces daghestanicus]GHI30148.1 acetyltransferase [Streptomyces daghestanicus]